MRGWKSTAVLVLALCLAWGLAAPASAQITTGAVTGTVTDAQGGVIPGATVIIISETQATKSSPVVTNTDGQYVIPNVTVDIYTVQVTMTGFRTFLRQGVRVSGGDRVVVETLVLQVGGTTENVTVTAESPMLQAATGERSSALTRLQLEDLPMSSHTFLEFIQTQIGVDARRQNQDGQRAGGGGQDNVMIDGISALDTGNNGLMGGLNLPQAAIAEVKLLTSGYQAEYGRSSGLQVSAVTRGGSNRFAGQVYLYERNSDWNANSWQARANGQPRPVNKQRDWGYVIGGPVGKPGGNNKLFFFYTHEYRPRQTGNTVENFRLPTAEERRGDFSRTLDNNGALYNLIYDASTGQPKANCSATIQTACFQDGGTVGKIPINRLYGPGIALLNQYPMPNNPQIAGRNYNHSVTLPVQDRLSYTPTVRLDYQATQTLRATWKFSGQSERIVPGFTVNGQGGQRALPGFTDSINKFPLSFNTSGTVNYSLSNTTFLEATYGVNQNRLGTPSIGPYSNKNNVVCPQDLAAQISNCTLGAIATLFPDAGIVDPGYYEYKALQEIGTPFFQDGRILLPPALTWGGTRIGSVPPSLNFPGWLNINRIQQFAASITKVANSHTLKAGVYFEHSYKAQNTGGNAFQGALNFGVDTNNPLESTYPFANAALGIFSTYNQGSRFIEGNFYYNSFEWYLQDNWKVSPRLTMDYGMRFVTQGPYVDTLQQVANFFPDKWNAAQAPVLYEAGCVGGVNPCAGNNRQAKDPRTGALLGPGTGSLIGQAIIGTGAFDNGMVQAGNGIDKAGYTFPRFVVGPRFGVAYDATGNQKLVLRGSVGLYFDRPDGNTAFSTVANPPTATSLTQQWGRLSDLANSQLAFGPVPQIAVNKYDSAIPKDLQWNAGVQYLLPWSSSVDVSWVGHHAFDVLANTQNQNGVNLNAIDVGTTLTSAGQDPTQAPGTALNNNLLRPFRGYSNINVQWPMWHRTYHSLQLSWQKRWRHGFSFQFNDTWTLYDKGNTSLPGPQLRLIHGPNGSYEVSPDQAVAEELFADQGTPTHLIVANGTWDLPDLPKNNKAMTAVGYVINDWQLSGIFRADSGQKYDVGYSYNTGVTGAALTGSPDYTARIVVLNREALGSGCSSDQYQQLKNTMVPATSGASPVTTAALAGPQVGSRGLESGRFLFTGCKDHRFDFAIQRTIRMGGTKNLQLRVDVYNAFNTVIFNGRQTNVQFNSATDFTVRNSQFRADGTMDPARTQPNQAGFGAATGAMALRTVQFIARFNF
jgi:Carboxypeptidase regulatory-like domain